MNYKNTFFQIDSMVVFKQTSISKIKVIRLDEDYTFDFEDHLSNVWKLIVEKKSFSDIINYFTQDCSLNTTEAENALTNIVSVLEEQKLGKTIQQ